MIQLSLLSGCECYRSCLLLYLYNNDAYIITCLLLYTFLVCSAYNGPCTFELPLLVVYITFFLFCFWFLPSFHSSEDHV